MDVKSQLTRDGANWKVTSGTQLEQAVISFIHKSWGSEISNYFPGPQPISIERKHFPLLKKGYVVCEKTDGVRHVLVSFMFGDKKMCFLVNRAFSIYVISLNLPKNVYLGTILDGELVDKTLYIYDAVYVGGEDLKQKSLLERLKSAEDVVKGVLRMKSDPLNLQMKIFYNLRDFEKFQTEHLPNVPYQVDGLVFTPIHEPIRIGTHETLFKWKPRDMNTIDFQAKRWENKWGLYVQEKGRLIFESELSFEKTPVWITEDCIVECQYMCEEEPRWWKPIGLRIDKKHPNNRKTFYRTLVNIRENIQISEYTKC
jgi:hypothetical protein